MKIVLQYWKQPKNKHRLISVSHDTHGLRLARHDLLFADDGVVPDGEAAEAELADFAPAATRLRESQYTFISDAELKLYVRFVRPS